MFSAETCALILLSGPHWFYAYVWLNPKRYLDFCKVYFKGDDPCRVFSKVAHSFKLVQFTTFTAYCFLTAPGGLTMSGLLRNIAPAQWVVGLLLGVLGQILNISIYTAIGHDGVYYGTKLGKTIPWCTTFPFTKIFGLFRIAHPQYIGSVLSIWGLVTLVYMSVNPGIFTVALGWSVFYAITGGIEEYY